MHGVYEDFLRDHLAIPVIPGEKTERERFPGALNTFTVEAMVQDRKAIQAGTSHFLGQNFSKAPNISSSGRDNTRQLAWTTSWGVSTRLIGTLIMAHGDDDGLVLPPRVAHHSRSSFCRSRRRRTRARRCSTPARRWQRHCGRRPFAASRSACTWTSAISPAAQKNWEWIKKGVPLRVEIGPRDITSRNVAVARRDQQPEGQGIHLEGAVHSRCG